MFVMHSVWEDFLTIVREELGSGVVETWFKAVTMTHWDALEKIVYLQTPNTFVCNWIEKKYRSIFHIHLARLLHVTDLKVVFSTTTSKHVSSSKKNALSVQKETQSLQSCDTFKPAQIASYATKHEIKPAKFVHYEGNINKSYSFDTFVVGSSNSLAYAAACAIAQKPGELYNPLFIYGDSGLGKTHLLHAIGNEIQMRNQQAVVLYQTADRFVSEFIYAIRFDQIHKFQKKYQLVDVLLIDDIQFISNKESTQEAFFHLFNALYAGRKQLVFSSDTFPQNINGIAERLRSRLACGMVTDIHQPCTEVKTAILKRKAESSGELLPDNVAHFLASCSTINIRELEGILIRVVAFAHLTKQDITLELAQQVLGSTHYNQTHKETIDIKTIIKVINKYYPYTLEELRSKNRNKDLVFARQITMYIIKCTMDKSLREIGAYIGSRNHTTVKHAVEKIKEAIAKNNKLHQQVEMIIKECT